MTNALYEVMNPKLAEVVYAIGDMIMSEELELEEILEQAIEEFGDQFSEEAIRQVYQQALNNM